MELLRLLLGKLDYYRGGFIFTHLEPLALSVVNGQQLIAFHVPGSGICGFTYIVSLMLLLGDYIL